MFESLSVLAFYHKDGTIEPLRFTMDKKEYRCGQQLSITDNRFAGNPMKIFRFKKGNKEYELHYEINTCKWYIKNI